MLTFPNVIERIGRNIKTIDIPTKLLDDRIIYLCGVIDEDSANIAIMQLLWLAYNSKDNEEINFYINSPGGDCTQGYAILDIIQHIDCKVNTIGVGECSSMAALLLASGTGSRRALKNCRVMIHSVQAMFHGAYKDIEIEFNESSHFQNIYAEYLSKFSKGKTSLKEMHKLIERNNYMTPETAIKIGLIDDII